MNKITFDHIYTIGEVVGETDTYKHYHYPEMLIRYDSNFIEFKRMPNVKEFVEAEKILREFHLKNGQEHMKFYFPENNILEKDLTDYVKESGYEIGFMELYAIDPKEFPTVSSDPDIEIGPVNEHNLRAFLDIQYEQDKEFGENFANQKVDLLKKQFSDPSIIQVLASYKGVPAGTVDVIVREETAEIDSLFVKESMQRKGIGSRLQRYVMDHYPNKKVILVADGEDTPREMYRKQNYEFLGYKYEIQKVFKD
jgi:GNAT superfamily N-acetyltransferase